MKWWAGVVLGGLALVGLAGVWGYGQQRVSSDPLYCVSKPGFLLGGDLGPLPPGYIPSCPTSESYRRDLEEGRGRVEIYTAPTQAALELRKHILEQTDYRVRTTDWPNSKTVLSMLRLGGRTVLYQAQVRGSETVVTLAD